MTRNDTIHWCTRHAGTLRTLGLAVVLCMSLLNGCREQQQPHVGSVQLKGSETLRPLLTICAEDFMARHPHIDVMVQGGGSGPGIAALLHGTVDIGMASRELSDKERQYAAGQGLEVRTFDVALDGITVVVHADNPVEVLTIEQLRGIFIGNLQNWRDVGGGVPQAIIVLSRMAGSGTAELFRQRVLGGADYNGTVQQMPTNEAIVTAVASQPWAIGYTGFGAVRVARGQVKLVALQASPQASPVAPTPETIRAQSYPLARLLHLHTVTEPAGSVKEFIDFCRSPRGQELVQKAGYLTIAP
jgi:phosphate transport system substrate-binding protein